MYTGISSEYQSAINKNIRRFTARIRKDNQTMDVQIKSYSLNRYSSSGEDYTLGCAFSASVGMTYIIDGVLKNQEISLETGLYVGSEIEYVPDGMFTILTEKERAGVITATGYDRMYVYGSKIFEVKQFPDTLSNMATEVAKQLGTTFDASCMSSGDDLQVTTMPENCTLQNLAGYLAGLLGRNAYIDRSGKLTFKAYTDSGFTFDGSRISDIDLDPTARTINCLKCTAGEDSDVLQSGSGNGYITMQNPLMTQTILDRMAAKVSGFVYYGAVVPFLLGDNRLDPWDIIFYKYKKVGETSYTDETGAALIDEFGNTFSDLDDEKIPILCHEIITSFDGGLQMDITSYALSESEQNGYKGPLQQVIENIKKETKKTVKSVSIAADTYVFKYSADTLVGADRANLTATAQNVSINRWQFLNESGSWEDYPQTSENSSITGTTLVVCPGHEVFVGDTAQIKLITDDPEVFDTLTITKLSDGSDGSNGSDGTGGLSVILGNEAATVACDSDGTVVEDTVIEIPFTGYTGIEQIACSCSRVGELPSGVSITKNTAATASASGLINFKFAFGATLGNTPNGTIELEFTISGKKVVKQFSWSKSTAGENGSTYILESDVQIVKKGANDVLSPKSITFSAYYRDGDTAARTAYAGRFKIYESTTDTSTWSLKYTSSSNQSSKTHTISSASVKFIKCILYAAGGTTTEITSITINVIEDAEGAVDQVDKMLTQKEIFNRLTNNGEAQGMYFDESTGDLYINATYIVSGILSSLGGESWINLEDGTFSFASGQLTYDPETGLKISGNLIADGKITIKKKGWNDAIIEYVLDEDYGIITDANYDDAGNYSMSMETASEFYSLQIRTEGLKIDKLIANLINCQFIYSKKVDVDYLYAWKLYARVAAVFRKGSYVHTATGTSGSTGYVKIAEFKITGTYCNTPTVLHILQRGREESVVSIWFNSVDSTDPTLKAFTHQGQPAYLVKSATSTWGLYIQKSEAYDYICVSEYHMAPHTSNRMTVTWTDTHASSLPSGYVTSAVYSPGDSGWITISSFLNSFAQASMSWTSTCKYRKIGNRVQVKGCVKSPSSWSGSSTIFFQLPSGYRPATRKYAIAPVTGSRIARIFADPSGNLYVEWVKAIADGAAVSGALDWIQIDIDFLID